MTHYTGKPGKSAIDGFSSLKLQLDGNTCDGRSQGQWRPHTTVLWSVCVIEAPGPHAPHLNKELNRMSETKQKHVAQQLGKHKDEDLNIVVAGHDVCAARGLSRLGLQASGPVAMSSM